MILKIYFSEYESEEFVLQQCKMMYQRIMNDYHESQKRYREIIYKEMPLALRNNDIEKIKMLHLEADEIETSWVKEGVEF